MKKNIAFLLISFFAASFSFAQITVVQFSIGYTSPLDIKHAGDDRLFIVEQGGRIKICDTAGVVKTTPFLNISTRIACCGERGLLGLAFDPNYKTNGFFYVDYTTSAAPVGSTYISRFKVSATNPDSADPNSEKVLLKIYQPYTNHNGGNLMFGPDGYLYINMGDGGSGGDPLKRAQNLDSLLGKMLRIDVNDTLYKIPADNPFVGKPGRDEIWAYGFRNPWRASFDRWTGDMWIGDVGQDTYEEVDFQPASSKGGENYGWRCYEGAHIFDTAGCVAASSVTFPVREIPQTSGAIAVVGGYRYRGAEFANMFGKYFYTDESTSAYGFHYLLPNGSGGWADTSLGALGRSVIVSFGEDRWGELYVADYNIGRIYKFQGQACSPAAYISDSSKIYRCDSLPFYLRTPEGKNFHYQWYADGLPVAGNDNDSLMVTASGSYSVMATNPASCSATSTVVEVIYAPLYASFTGLDTFYCAYNASAPLVGSPAGGTFSGSGITGSTFDPALAGLGIDTVVYTVTDNTSGCTSSSSMIVEVDACLSTGEKHNMPLLRIYPNPNNGEFNVIINTLGSENIKVEITDAVGRIVYNDEWNLPAGYYTFPIKPGHLAKGVYTFKATSGERISAHRFTVQ